MVMGKMRSAVASMDWMVTFEKGKMYNHFVEGRICQCRVHRVLFLTTDMCTHVNQILNHSVKREAGPQ